MRDTLQGMAARDRLNLTDSHNVRCGSCGKRIAEAWISYPGVDPDFMMFGERDPDAIGVERWTCPRCREVYEVPEDELKTALLRAGRDGVRDITLTEAGRASGT